MSLLKIDGLVKFSGLAVWKELEILAVAFEDSPPAISNNTTDADHDIDIAARTVLSDECVPLITQGTLTKQLDAAWAEGDNAGGLDTGIIAVDTWYAVWAIGTSNKKQDILFSTSSTSPTMPSGYIYKRRIGWILTDSSANILPFMQIGDWFYWLTPVVDMSTSPGAGTNITVTAPVNTLGLLQGRVQDNDADIPQLSVSPTWATSDWPRIVEVKAPGSGGTGVGSGYGTIPIDGSNEVFAKALADGDAFSLTTVGWQDRRGRDS